MQTSGQLDSDLRHDGEMAEGGGCTAASGWSCRRTPWRRCWPARSSGQPRLHSVSRKPPRASVGDWVIDRAFALLVLQAPRCRHNLRCRAGMAHSGRRRYDDRPAPPAVRPRVDSRWPHGAAAASDVALLGRFYERFADQAVDIARRVVFQLSGRVGTVGSGSDLVASDH